MTWTLKACRGRDARWDDKDANTTVRDRHELLKLLDEARDALGNVLEPGLDVDGDWIARYAPLQTWDLLEKLT